MGLFRFRVGAPEGGPNNTPPEWETVPTLTAAYNVSSADVGQYCVDPEGGTLAFSKGLVTVEGDDVLWPSHLLLNATTGEISATVSTPVATYQNLAIIATDIGGLSTQSNTFSLSVIKGQNRAPAWSSTIPTQNTTPGSSFFLAGYVNDIDADSITYSSGVPQLPANVVALNTSSGQVSVLSTAPAGNYQFRVRASDGTVTVDSPLITLTVQAVDASLSISQDYAFITDSVYPSSNVFYNNGQVDKRGGFIGWCDGDHGYTHAGAGSVRYFNYNGTSPYASRFEDIESYQADPTIASQGFLHKPYTATNVKDSTTGRYVAEEDNYPYFYSPKWDVMIWVFGGSSNGGGSYGIFDMAPYYGANQGGAWEEFKGAQWIYGNSSRNADDWPSGPYHNSFIKDGFSGTLAPDKNAPNGFLEPLDKAVQLQWGIQNIFVIEPNPTFNLASAIDIGNEPYRIQMPLVRDFACKINVTQGTRNTIAGETESEWITSGNWGSGHNQFINCGVPVGEWMYYIKPATGGPNSANPPTAYITGERDSFLPVTIDGTTYAGYKTREFWRWRMVAPYNQFEKLAQYPEFEILPYNGVTNPLYGPSLYYDRHGHKIYALHKELWEYDIAQNVWRKRTPSTYKRVFNSVGGVFPISEAERHLVYEAGAAVDGATTAERKSWHRLRITGGVAPVARFVSTEFDQAYPGAPNKTPTGKHRRFLYSNYYQLVSNQTLHAGARYENGALVDTKYETTTSATQRLSDGGFVWSIGGDYGGIPQSQVTNYPPGVYENEQSARQDQYRIHTKEVNGKQQYQLACNMVSYYPYPGGPDPSTTQPGPAGPDGVGFVFDKRGVGWVGPGYWRFDHFTTPPSYGPIDSCMFKFRLPDKHTDGVRKGNAWELPAQTRINAGRTPVVCTVGGTANSITLTTGAALTSYRRTPPIVLQFTATSSNTGSVFVNVDGLGLKQVKKNVAQSLVTGDIVSGQTYTITYDGYRDFLLHGANDLPEPTWGLSNAWTAYDPVGDQVVYMTLVEPWKFWLHRFNCLPDANGVHQHTRTLIDFTQSWWQTQANLIARNGATASPTGGLRNAGSQAVVGDYLYTHICAGVSTGGYSDRNLAYMVRINLRDVTSGGVNTYKKMIPYPTYWVRGYDAIPNIEPGGVGSTSEYRDFREMGHLIVLGPPAFRYEVDDPWCAWYDTNRETWTVGKTYSQMRSADPSLPATFYDDEYSVVRQGPRVSKGMMCTVPETGELWYFTSGDASGSTNTRNGIIKYRIW